MFVRSAVLTVAVTTALMVSGCSGKGAKEAPPKAAGGPPEIDRLTPLPSPIPEVVARVNGVPVPRGPVLALAARGMKGSVDPDKDRPAVVRTAVNQYVVRELLLQEAVARNLSAKQEDVDAAFDKARGALEGEAGWKEKLAEDGLDPETYRAELRAQMTVGVLLAKLAGEVPTPSDQEASAFYAANPALFWNADVFKASRILVAVEEGAPEGTKAAARRKADSIAARLKAGEPFEAVARKSSDDPDAKKTGGLMPPFTRGKGVAPVEDALLAMKPGEISEVISTPAGFEIVHLHERVDARAVPFEEVKPRVQEALRQQANHAHIQELVNRLRASAKIDTYL